MNTNIKNILGALAITAYHKKILAILILLNTGHLFIKFHSSEIWQYANYFLTFVSLTSTPFIYAYLYEFVAEKQHLSISGSFKKYFIKYILLSLILGIPTFLAMQIMKLMEFETISPYPIESTYLLISVAEIYILPLFFKTEKIFPSIYNGIFFLVRNLDMSITTIAMTLVTFVSGAIIKYYLYNPIVSVTISKSILGFGIALLSTLLTFSIFVLATINMKTKEIKNFA